MTNSKREKFWRSLLSAAAIFLLSVGAASLFFLQREIHASWAASLDQFRWAVLVDGTQIEIDEVGRFLKQLDGVGEVTLISSDEVLARLKNDPMIGNDLQYLDQKTLPPTWVVSWREAGVDYHRMEDALQETHRFPGVVDVAFDSSTLNRLHVFKMHWLQVRAILWLLIVGGIAWTALLIGRFLFFAPVKKFAPKEFLATVFLDEAWWAIGAALVWRTLGTFYWPVALGGTFVGILHWMWEQTFQGSDPSQ